MRRRIRSRFIRWIVSKAEPLDLPIAAISYTETSKCHEVSIEYRGRCFSFIDGYETWSVNGVFTVSIPVTT